jgi:hypothetical protein
MSNKLRFILVTIAIAGPRYPTSVHFRGQSGRGPNGPQCPLMTQCEIHGASVWASNRSAPNPGKPA